MKFQQLRSKPYVGRRDTHSNALKPYIFIHLSTVKVTIQGIRNPNAYIFKSV